MLVNNLANANVSKDNPLKIGGFLIFLTSGTFCIGRILAMYQKTGGRHGYVESDVHVIDFLSYISVEVFVNVYNNLFSNVCKAGGILFAHIIPKHVIYYVGFDNDIVHLNNSTLELKQQLFTSFTFFPKNS